MSEKTIEERIKELETKIDSLMMGERRNWFETIKNEIENRCVIPRTEILNKYPAIDNRSTERKFLVIYPEIRKLQIPYKGSKMIYVYTCKDGNYHPVKLLLNNWNILIERKGLPFVLIKEKEKCPDEQIIALKRWCKKHLSKWLLVNDEGIYKK